MLQGFVTHRSTTALHHDSRLTPLSDFMTRRKHPSEWPEEQRWWEKHKIVVWSTAGGEISEEFGCGDTPEEVIDSFRERSWIEEERDSRQKYMEGVQSRLPIAHDETFVFVDAESFLQGMVKIGAMRIQKWEWEPDDDKH